VGHGHRGAGEGFQAVLQGLRRLQVQVVGRLVEQQQRGAGQLEQQDLEPGLLTADSDSNRCSADLASS
jgi:hypothetical protein